ncbi:ABC transporter permease [Herbaspirillum sp. BH-1]|jgi:peptide/nickel transport system permease protein|uniref:Binding-protein-dependent transport system inner membrane protein n=2 Tax=Herbaspirillum frisingense TaxID=92645 RepID=A0AAI9IF23_9BURK|nr:MULTISPECIES: ABC transporter permease [Herbaspirillum]EOA04633.1 binding-protein-dependent transport system inner membrane protein [Herbaspirillum frisingense GSF30]MCI1016024.1 ABC transporter permease [Herbaspirillum sp. C7C2]MDR6581895.1 peptide/nickel transport system permease protein [Herbaspirillum frisingense]ONN63688.1 peptide ABC transporter [Herbaspirillum sp. VT-16-41]PLY57060.1 ABC transporter permease [Herbaspirillum sp. BH-1]
MPKLLKRLLLSLPTLLLVSMVVFSLLAVLPGDPVAAILGMEATPEAAAALRLKLGLDDPLLVQYGRWLWAVLHGDLGRSFIDNTPVADALWQRLPVTIELAIGSFLVAVIIAVPAGILSAARPRGWANAIGTLIALFGMSVPHFWLGMLFIILFAVKLGWLPASGFVPLSVDWHANLIAMIMPMVVTGLRESAILMRMVRSSLLEVLNEDYIRTAFSKGLRDWQVVLGHALRNAMIPVLTASGLMVSGMLGGLVITESIFGIPGMGKMIVDAIFQRDYVTVQAGVLAATVMVVIVNLGVDLLYSVIDPRISR